MKFPLTRPEFEAFLSGLSPLARLETHDGNHCPIARAIKCKVPRADVFVDNKVLMIDEEWTAIPKWAGEFIYKIDRAGGGAPVSPRHALTVLGTVD